MFAMDQRAEKLVRMEDHTLFTLVCIFAMLQNSRFYENEITTSLAGTV